MDFRKKTILINFTEELLPWTKINHTWSFRRENLMRDHFGSVKVNQAKV